MEKALCASHLMMSRRLAEAQAEVQAIRRDFGYVRVEDPTKLYIASILQHKGKYRIVAPPGGRYFLHLTETDSVASEIPTEKKPWITVCLNGWKDGAEEIFSYRFGLDIERDTPKLRVHSDKEDFFTYVPENWVRGVSMAVKKYELDATPQAEFATDQDILLVHAKTPSLDRGVMLWLEPETNYEARIQARSQKKEPSVAPEIASTEK